MKKFLVICAAMAMVFAFTMPVAAHTPCCEDCTCKSALGTIDCPVTAGINEAGSCDWFDYDDDAVSSSAITTFGSHGYTPQNTCHKVLFDICCCTDNLDAFVSDNTIGIRMTSLTSGFYFSSDQLFFNPYDRPAGPPVNTDACEATSMADARSFGTSYNYFANAARTVTGYPEAKDDNCTVGSLPAVVVETPCNAGYQLQAADIDDAFCYWWLDMPAMVYDKAVAEKGASVMVKIELISATNPGTICDECRVICECTVDLGVYCPVSDPTTQCIYFPYVLPGDASWKTGIVVTNLNPASVAPADMALTLTLTDSAGNLFTYSPTVSETTWNGGGWLNDWLDEFEPVVAGDVIAPGAGLLKVTSTATIDGYEFLTDDTFGAGTLARPCNWPCPCLRK